MTSVRSVRFRGITALAACLVALALVAACTASSGTGPNPSGTYSQPSYTTAGPSSTAVTPTTASTSTSKSPMGRTKTGSSTTKTSTGATQSISDRNTRPGEKPPVLLAAGRKDDPFGASAFAIYWVQTLDWAIATMNSSLAKNIESASCSTCRSFVDIVVDSVARRDRYYEGGRITATSSFVSSGDGVHSAEVSLVLDQTSLRVLTRSGSESNSAGAVRGAKFYLDVGWVSGRWLIERWGRVIS